MSVQRARELIAQALAELDLITSPPPVTPPPVVTPPSPPKPSGPADYVVSPEDWAWASNYRLPIAGDKSVSVSFTTPGLGKRANINVAADSGYNGRHTMTIDGRSITSQTPTFYLVTGPSVFTSSPYVKPPQMQWQGLLPNTSYVATITSDEAEPYHINFQGAG